MNFELLTLTGAKFAGEATEVSLVTSGGQIGILPHHEPLTAIAVPGPVSVRTSNNQRELFAIFGGLLEVFDGQVRLLADEAEHAEELILSEIEAAVNEAQRLKEEAKDKHELQLAQELIDRHAVRLEVARLHRSHRGAKKPLAPESSQ